jgi:hypothetical protein
MVYLLRNGISLPEAVNLVKKAHPRMNITAGEVQTNVAQALRFIGS